MFCVCVFASDHEPLVTLSETMVVESDNVDEFDAEIHTQSQLSQPCVWVDFNIPLFPLTGNHWLVRETIPKWFFLNYYKLPRCVLMIHKHLGKSTNWVITIYFVLS